MTKTIASRVKLRRTSENSIAWRVRQRHGSVRKTHHLRRKAQELARKIKRWGPEHAFGDRQEVLFYLSCPDFPYLHLYNPTTLTEFLEECEKLSLYDAAFVAAEVVQQVHKAIPVLCRNEAYVERLVKSFCHQRKWKLLHRFLVFGSFSHTLFSWLVYFFEHEMSVKSLHEDEEEVIACLFEKCHKFILLKHIAKKQQVQIFQKIRFWKMPPGYLEAMSLSFFCALVLFVMRENQGISLLTAESQSKKFLTKMIKSGFLIARDFQFQKRLCCEVTQVCRGSRYITLFRLLYRLGLLRNAYVQHHLNMIKRKGFHIDQSYASELRERDVCLIQVEEYIQKAAATPRHLEDLCVTRVSQLVGCREDRELGVEKLGLGQHLTERVLMIDVCREIERGMSSDLDLKRDPPGLLFCHKSVQDCLDILGNR